MSTLALVLIVLAVSVFGVAALSFVRWREGKRLAYARKVVEYSDAIALLDNIGNELQPWLSSAMLRFIGNAIHAYHKKLLQLKAPENKKTDRAVNHALYWIQTQQKLKQALPGSPQQAQKFRDNVRNLLTALKDSYKLNLISIDEVKALLNEAKQLNIGVTLAVLRDKVSTAEKIHNSKQALHYLKKAEQLLAQQSDLSAELLAAQQQIQQQMSLHTEKIEHEKMQATSRLIQDAAKLSEEDESWKKKRF